MLGQLCPNHFSACPRQAEICARKFKVPKNLSDEQVQNSEHPTDCPRLEADKNSLPTQSLTRKQELCWKASLKPNGDKNTCVGVEEDAIWQLEWAQQVVIFRLRTGQCQLLSHLYRLKLSLTDDCPCGTGPQTPEHGLQDCPTFNNLIHEAWPCAVELREKLWGPAAALNRTADFTLQTRQKI